MKQDVTLDRRSASDERMLDARAAAGIDTSSAAQAAEQQGNRTGAGRRLSPGRRDRAGLRAGKAHSASVFHMQKSSLPSGIQGFDFLHPLLTSFAGTLRLPAVAWGHNP